MTSTFFTDRDLGNSFPAILRDAGLTVERHADHFAPDERDEDWLAEVARRQWVALTHDRRIRYEPNKLDTVRRTRARLLILVGKASTRNLARSFVNTIGRVEAYLEGRTPPLIAKVYRPSPKQLERDPGAPGRVEHWYP